MLKENFELRAEARMALTDKWVMAAVATLVMGAVAGAASYIPVAGTCGIACDVRICHCDAECIQR